MKPEQHNYEILFLLFADTHRAGSFGKCLPREECRKDATHFSIIFASDGNWPNYRTVHYFWYITWVQMLLFGFLITAQTTEDCPRSNDIHTKQTRMAGCCPMPKSAHMDVVPPEKCGCFGQESNLHLSGP